uniref:Fork-head domain-containing protein n=1 Tax=Amazona collaria TaxID=241587 RepID=A0A8B9FEA8_9PSIT
MWVNPSLACPLPGSPGADPDRSKSLVASNAGATESSSLNASWDGSGSDFDCSKEDVPSPSTYPCPSFYSGLTNPCSFFPSSPQLTEDEAASSADIPVPQEMLKSPEMSAKIEGGWPRPPLSYCNLISLALCNSAGGSLTVQQIYRFTRQHFPFFQKAPEGWKSTIPHNLRSSSCFEKSTSSTCAKGNHKSCLWKLTPGGHRKFREEAQALTKESLDLVRQSMSNPDLMSSLFGL